MQANVIALHCKILKLDCVGYLIPGDVPKMQQVLQQGLYLADLLMQYLAHLHHLLCL